ncbi:DUF6350 family protein [Kitasatospora sp. NPDC002227]|uniref:cell division protein PerM n=1 Tax=Kitasatospora sp. NPDC002227 TaxID=3154773 RepID=UPI0033316456
MTPMTQLMGRPILGLPGELGARSVLADLLAGVRTALLGLAVVAAPVYGLWVLAPYADDTAASAGRLTCALWLLGHGAPLTRGEAAAPLTLTPLLPTLLAVTLLHRAGLRCGRRGRPSWRAPSALCAGYLLAAAGAVTQCTTAGLLRARPLPDLLAVAALAAAAVGSGYLRAAPLDLPGRLPHWLWPPGAGPVVGRAAAAGGYGLVAGGALVLLAALLLGAGAAGHSAAGLGGGVAGYTALLLSSACYLPDAVVWGGAYALGPGFAVGAGTAVGPAGVRLGAVPDFPLFALLPDGTESTAGGWRLAVLGLPLLAGVVPALVLRRARAAGAPDGRPGRWHPVATAVAALTAALLVGAAAALASHLAAGALAPGRMRQLGPSAWRTALAATVWTAAVTLPGAYLPRLAPAGWAVRRTVYRAVCLPAPRRGQG